MSDTLISPEKLDEFSHSIEVSNRGSRCATLPTSDLTSSRLRVSEQFESVQGEGLLTGTPSHFIRLVGCNLRCWFCDTPYASWQPEGTHRSVSEVVDQAVRSGCRHVVLTGGEPLLSVQVVPLCKALRDAGMHLTIETAGTVLREVACDLLSISPKMSNSAPRFDDVNRPRLDSPSDPERGALGSHWIRRHEELRWQPKTLLGLIEQSDQYQVKFVLDAPHECQEVLQAVETLNLPVNRVWIMPQALSPEDLDRQAIWLKPWCQSHQFHYCDRMQLRWYGAKRGT